jgi:DNA helicase HerA-like ATPase
VKKIGEVVSASVLRGLEVKLELENPEDLRIGYPVMVKGKKYDFYCIVRDIFNQSMDIAERLAGSHLKDTIVPGGHEGYGGKIFYSKAELRPIQLIDKNSSELSEPQTIPPYFSEARHATKQDVEKIYKVTRTSAPLGTLRGISNFWIDVDVAKLTEKPFAIFGRTGVGKSIFNKILCSAIISKDVANLLIFDMHGEYGVISSTDNTEGLKFYFPNEVEIFSLDPGAKGRAFIISSNEIRPSDIIVAFQDLSSGMIDALYAVNRMKGERNLLSAIEEAEAEDYGERILHPSSLSGLQRRMTRLNRFDFIKPVKKDVFSQIKELIKSGKSIVIDFGRYGTDQMAYLFIANVLARRLYDLYTEHNEEYPRLVLFLEEAHKFLAPGIASYTIFNKLAREMRKFNLILALVDQRPSRIDDEVRSQLANRLVLSLKEPGDVTSALAGIPDKSVWENIIGTIPPRTIGLFGDAVRIPTVIEVMEYNQKNMKKHIVGDEKMTESDLNDIAKNVDEIFKF